jgi:CheY-like chemotaxis protein
VPADDELARCRILLVEDETLIAMDLEAALRRRGCEVVGPFASVDQAVPAVAAATGHRRLDGAILDVNLGDHELVFPVADALAERGVPFVFITGYDRETLPPAHRGRPAVNKPYREAELIRTLARAVAERR